MKRIKGILKEEILVSAAGILILAGLIVFLGINSSTRLVFGNWVDPTNSPPNDNRPTPILATSTIAQTRIGELWIRNNIRVDGKLRFEGKSLSFERQPGVWNAIGDEGYHILIGTSSERYFVFVTQGAAAGRMAIGTPVPTAPAQTLQVVGTAQITGAATTTGVLTLNSRANACRQVYMTGTNGETFCCKDEPNCPNENPYWVVGVHNTSGVLQNPNPPPAQPYNMICCKRYQ